MALLCGAAAAGVREGARARPGGAWGAENGEEGGGDTAERVGGEVDDLFAERPLEFLFPITTRSFSGFFLIPVAFPGFY
jgi:hypothetical protein